MILKYFRTLTVRSNRRGVSQAISSIILVMTAMLVSLTAFFFTQLNLTMLGEETEFENAKRAMVSLARIIESLEEGDAHYVTLSMSSGGPEIIRGIESIRLTLWDDYTSRQPLELNLGKVNLIKIRGGMGVPGSFRVLRGDVSVKKKNDLLDKCIMIRPDNPSPMGVVYQDWDMRAWVVVDFGRVRVMPTGTVPRTDDRGRSWYRVNTVDIVYYNITFGEISSSGGTFNFYVRVKDVKRYPDGNKYYPENFTFYSPTISIRIERGTEDKPDTYKDEWEVPGFAGAPITIVYLAVVNIEVSLR